MSLPGSLPEDRIEPNSWSGRRLGKLVNLTPLGRITLLEFDDTESHNRIHDVWRACACNFLAHHRLSEHTGPGLVTEAMDK